MGDPEYRNILDRELLKMSFSDHDSAARRVLNLRQKHRQKDELEDVIKKAKAWSKKELIPVLRACVRASLALRPPQILTDSKSGNKMYIGYLLLHPDHETAELACAVLVEVVKQERVLLAKVLTALTNFVLQFYIDEAHCIAVLLQTLTS